MQDDPWEQLKTPDGQSLASSRRVDASLPFDLFWAVDPEQRRMLVLEFATPDAVNLKLPRLRHLFFRLSRIGDGRYRLVLGLDDPGQKELFRTLCQDIVEAVRPSDSEVVAAATFVARTWRWHALLRGGKLDILSKEAQKGLIGELDVLGALLLKELAPREAVGSWSGPLGTAKDFELGRLCLEAKARSGASRPFIEITSEFQLDTEGIDQLFLHVIELDLAPEGVSEAFTLTQAALGLMDRLQALDPLAAIMFEERLFAYGFDLQQNYEDYRWVGGQRKFFAVREDFPRITPVRAGQGIHQVRYRIALSACERFLTEQDSVLRSIEGARHVTDS